MDLFLAALFALERLLPDALIWLVGVTTALMIRRDWRASLFVAVAVAGAYGLAAGVVVQGYLTTTGASWMMHPLTWVLINGIGVTLIWCGVRWMAFRPSQDREPGP